MHDCHMQARRFLGGGGRVRGRGGGGGVLVFLLDLIVCVGGGVRRGGSGAFAGACPGGFWCLFGTAQHEIVLGACHHWRHWAARQPRAGKGQVLISILFPVVIPRTFDVSA